MTNLDFLMYMNALVKHVDIEKGNGDMHFFSNLISKYKRSM